MWLFNKKHESMGTYDQKNQMYLKAPKDRKLIQNLAYLMFTVGLNSQEWSWYTRQHPFIIRLHRILFIFLQPLTTVSQVVYTSMNYTKYSFQELTVMFCIIPVSFTMMIKILIAQTPFYKKAMRDYMDKLHLFHYHSAHPDDIYAKQMFVTVEKFTRVTLFFVGFNSYLSTLAWLTVPLYHNVTNNPDLNNITVRLEVCMYIWLPFDYEYNFRNYLFTLVISVYCAFSGITTMYTFDAVMFGCLYNLIGHLKIFRNRLKTGFKEDMSQDDIKSLLGELSTYFMLLRETLSTYENAFGINVAFIYLQNLVEGVILLYTTMAGDITVETFLTYGLMIPYLQGGLVIISIICEYIRTLADDIPNMVYELDWEKMSLSNQKILLVFLGQVQVLFEYTAAFKLKTGLQPGVNIIKTTFSYFVMVKSAQK